MDKNTIPLDRLPVPKINPMRTPRGSGVGKPELKRHLDEYYAPGFIKSYFRV